MKVGNVSSAAITDATPAVLAAHISQRGCQGPAGMGACPTETKEAGGPGSIAEQEVDHEVDVLLGGGRSFFEQEITGGPDAGKTVIESAEDKGYRYVTDAAGMAAVSDDQRPLLGLFTPSHMSLEWSGPAASLGKGNDPVACDESQRPANEPNLAAMTDKAADHSHTSQIVSESVGGAGLPPGYTTNLTTKDGQTMSLTYGTAGYDATETPLPPAGADLFLSSGD